ncbi:MAG: glycerophosphodiester phosphodiesterase [Actinomycetota bacterium]
MPTVAPTVSKVMAHRGGRHGGAPNTVEAIEHAHRVGAASAEIDVNVTTDGVLLATHDGILPGASWITEATYEDLVANDADEWSGRRLEDVVGFALSKGMVAYLDIKAVTPAGLKEIAQIWPAELADHQLVFASARGDVIAWIGDNLDGAATSFLYYDPMVDLRSFAGFMAPTFAHPCFDFLRQPFRTMNESYVERARSLGFSLVSWSVNEADEITELDRLGFDFICTDEPELAAGITGPAN